MDKFNINDTILCAKEKSEELKGCKCGECICSLHIRRLGQGYRMLSNMMSRIKIDKEKS